MFIDNNGIIHQSHIPESEVTLEDVKQELAMYPILNNNRKAFVLINLSNVKSVEKQARDYLGGEFISQYVSAVVLVAPNMMSKILGNFFLGLNKTLVPVKLCISIEDGLEWLKSQISNQQSAQ